MTDDEPYLASGSVESVFDVSYAFLVGQSVEIDFSELTILENRR